MWYEQGSAALPDGGRMLSGEAYPCAACCTGKQPQLEAQPRAMAPAVAPAVAPVMWELTAGERHFAFLIGNSSGDAAASRR